MSDELAGAVELLEGMAFRATTGSGHTLILDAASRVGGADRGPRPMELFLIGLGGCTGMDVISILRKMRQDVRGYQIQVRGREADHPPHVFTWIGVEHVVRGRDVNPDAVRRAVELSTTRYCPGIATLGKTATIEISYRVIDEQAGTEVTGTLAPAGVAPPRD